MKNGIFTGICLILLSGGYNVHAQEKLGKAEKSFSRVKADKGTREITLKTKDGKNWKAKITFPEPAMGQNSLVIALHWAGDFGTYREFNDCLVLPALESLDAIIISPEGEAQVWSTDKNVEKIRSIVKNAVKYWKVDPNQIAVMGYSNGGNGSWYFAEHYPNLFSAAIPMAGLYPITKKLDVPIYAIHGARDELFPVKKTVRWIERTKDAGTDITFVVNERLSHFQGCSYIDELKKAGEWLQRIWTEK